jgi:hypothetical protein
MMDMDAVKIRLDCLKVVAETCLGKSVNSANELIEEAKLLEAWVTSSPQVGGDTGKTKERIVEV